MRRFLLPALLLLVAGCATAPRAVVPPVQPGPVQQRSSLSGLTAGELLQRFGQPALQIREGPGLKLQFRGRGCVLDAYLYGPPRGQGPERVTHIDTRFPTGADADQAGCIAALQRA